MVSIAPVPTAIAESKMAAAAAAAENGGAPRTELQELQMKSNQATDEVSKRVGASSGAAARLTPAPERKALADEKV